MNSSHSPSVYVGRGGVISDYVLLPTLFIMLALTVLSYRRYRRCCQRQE